jgi:glycosyltransferase involved in cell wall biosynthesis
MNKILLHGPNPDNRNGVYGGGKGGYTRNVKQYLNTFNAENIRLKPCYYSIRKSGRYYYLQFPLRLISDFINVIRESNYAKGIHVLAQYRTAIYREYLIVMLCKILRIPVLYDIKAGVFIDWYNSCSRLKMSMITYILKNSKQIFCEGIPYVDFLKKKGFDSVYFPNFIQSNERVESTRKKLTMSVIKCLFVGYCYKGKGIYELIEGLERALILGVPIELTIIGEESPEFTRWLDQFEIIKPAFQINRNGKSCHEDVMQAMSNHDVFFMPSKHYGEGHNNSINEAMLMGMVIVSTKNGFLDSVLNDECAFFLDPLSVDNIVKLISEIDKDRKKALGKSENAQKRVLELFSDTSANKKMYEAYSVLING